MAADNKPRIAVIGTGGSISTVGRHNLDLYEYGDYGTVLEIDELLERFPEVYQEAEIQPVRFRAIPSTGITPSDWLELARLIDALAEEHAGVNGIVITHGTATLEETAYFLTLTLKTGVPVVLVGSQRPPNGLSTDAGLNLLNAVRTAASPDAVGLGVLVLLNDEIQAAREITKTSTYRLETFRTPDLGMLGYADPDRVVIYRRPTRRHAPDTEFDVRTIESLPRVDIAYSYAGSDGTAIEAFVARGARAIVLAALAPGKPTPDEARAVQMALERGVRVIQCTRAGSGRVIPRTRLMERGIVAADNLNPQKARVLTMLGFTVTDDVAELQRIFDTY